MDFIMKRLDEINGKRKQEESKDQLQPITVKLPESTVEDLEYLAKQLNMSRHALMVELITDGVENAKDVIINYDILN